MLDHRTQQSINAMSDHVQPSLATLSPRLRHDFLLLHKPLISARTALEAFATPEGVEAFRDFPNLVSRAENLLPGLQDLIKTLTSEFVAARVCMALDGVPLGTPIDADVPADLFGE